MAHLKDTGDTSYFADGEFCGTRGPSRPVEAISVRINLTASATRRPAGDGALTPSPAR